MSKTATEKVVTAKAKTTKAKVERVKVKVNEKQREQIELIKKHLSENIVEGIEFSDETVLLIALGYFVGVKKLSNEKK